MLSVHCDQGCDWLSHIATNCRLLSFSFFPLTYCYSKTESPKKTIRWTRYWGSTCYLHKNHRTGGLHCQCCGFSIYPGFIMMVWVPLNADKIVQSKQLILGFFILLSYYTTTGLVIIPSPEQEFTILCLHLNKNGSSLNEDEVLLQKLTVDMPDLCFSLEG